MFSFFYFLVGAGASLVTLGLTEAVVKPIAQRQTKRLIKAYVPKLLDKLDSVLPSWLGQLSEDEIRTALEMFIWEEAESRNETLLPKDVDTIISDTVTTYSFLTNAAKLLK
jgi:hypothetical protein